MSFTLQPPRRVGRYSCRERTASYTKCITSGSAIGCESGNTYGGSSYTHSHIQIYDHVLSSLAKRYNSNHQQEDDDEQQEDQVSLSSSSILHQIASDAGLSHKLLVRRTALGCNSNNNYNNNLDETNKGDKGDGGSRSDDHQDHIIAGPQSLLELALDQILMQLNDTSPYVEYWCRQEWRHIEAHADIDEFRAVAEATAQKNDTQHRRFRYPTHAHVLYLQVGNETRGPTCLFDNITSGGELSKQESSSFDGGGISLVTVPAVKDRLLRFPGTILHAVPRPADLWLLPFVQGTPNFDPHQFARSVVLFNTWSDDYHDGGPPWNVPQLDESSTNAIQGQMKEEALFLVNPKKDWIKVGIRSSSMPDDERENNQETTSTHNNDVTSSSPSSSLSSSSFTKKTKIWLLGDFHRRQQEQRTVNLYSNEEMLRLALMDPIQPHETKLYPHAHS